MAFQRTQQKSIAQDRIRKFNYDNNSGQSGGTVFTSQTSTNNISSNEIFYCKTVSTSNITLSGEQTINDHLTDSEFVLVNGQSTSSQNGIYLSNSSSWTRVERNLNDIALIKVVDGYFEGSYWEMTTRGVEVGTDNIDFIPLQASINPYTEQANDTNFHLATDNGQYIVSAIDSDNYDNIDYTFEGDIVQKDSNGDLQNYGTIRQLEFTVTSAELKALNTTPLEIIPPRTNCLIEILSLPVFRYNYISGTYANSGTTFLAMEESGTNETFYRFPTDIGAQISSFNGWTYYTRVTAGLSDLFTDPRLMIDSDANWTGTGTSTLTIKLNYRYRYML